MMKKFKFQIGDVLMKKTSRAQYRPRYQVVIVTQGCVPTWHGPVGLRFIVASYFTPKYRETRLLIGDDVDWFEDAYKLFRRSK
jgi:hypothetical protein